ncbi:MAG TPA: hypothetical protein VID51_06050 [Solirubrobacterales bacterium]
MSAAAGNDATCGNHAPNVENPFVFAEEIEVEREAHANGVDARATWDEEAGTGVCSIEESEPEQAGMESRRDWDLPTEHGRNLEPAQARCKRRFRHSVSRGRKGRSLPLTSIQ